MRRRAVSVEGIFNAVNSWRVPQPKESRRPPDRRISHQISHPRGLPDSAGFVCPRTQPGSRPPQFARGAEHPNRSSNVPAVAEMNLNSDFTSVMAKEKSGTSTASRAYPMFLLAIEE